MVLHYFFMSVQLTPVAMNQNVNTDYVIPTRASLHYLLLWTVADVVLS